MRKIIESYGFEFITVMLFLALFHIATIVWDATHELSFYQLLH